MLNMMFGLIHSCISLRRHKTKGIILVYRLPHQIRKLFICWERFNYICFLCWKRVFLIMKTRNLRNCLIPYWFEGEWWGPTLKSWSEVHISGYDASIHKTHHSFIDVILCYWRRFRMWIFPEFPWKNSLWFWCFCWLCNSKINWFWAMRSPSPFCYPFFLL
jgi:hypothetical protein